MEKDYNQSKDFQKVLQITRRLAAQVNLDDLLQLIIDTTLDLLDAQRASVFLYEPKTNELVSKVAHGADSIRFPADKGIAGSAIKTGQTLLIPDAYSDPRFNPEIDRKTGFKTRNILTVPLPDHEGNLTGVLQVLNKNSGDFDPRDIELAETLAAQAGVSLQRARLIEHFVDKQRMLRAMQIAQEIQQDILPDADPRISGFDIAGFSRPADLTGGDIYDYFELDGGKLLLTVADASGHGVGPAMVVAETRAMIRANARDSRELGRILEISNDLLAMDLDGRFVTCFTGIIKSDGGEITFVSAGHGPMLHFDAAKNNFEQIGASGLPLGVMEGATYEAIEIRKLNKGDLFLIMTDGFFEAMNSTGEMFGIQRVCDNLTENIALPADKMLLELCGAVDRFSAGLTQSDDLTAILIKKQ